MLSHKDCLFIVDLSFIKELDCNIIIVHSKDNISKNLDIN